MASKCIEGLLSIDESITKCALCLETYTEPKLLDCFHTFCKDCVIQLLHHEETHVKEVFLCPLCRLELKIPTNGIDGIKRNYYIEALLSREQATCQTCEDDIKAVKKCFECQQFMCSRCFVIHQKIRTTRSHKSVDVDPNSRMVTHITYCSRHKDEELKFFCFKCKLNICRDCKMTKHEGHKTEDIDTVAGKSKEALAPILEQLLNVKSSLCEKTKSISNASQKLNEQKEAIINDIKGKGSQLHEDLDLVIDSLIEKVAEHFKNQNLQIENDNRNVSTSVTSVNGYIRHVEHVLKSGPAPDIIQAEVGLKSRDLSILTNACMGLEEGLNIPFFVPRDGLQFNSKTVGTITQTKTKLLSIYLKPFNTFECQCPLNYFIASICTICNTTNAWVLLRHRQGTSINRMFNPVNALLYTQNGSIINTFSNRFVLQIISLTREKQLLLQSPFHTPPFPSTSKEVEQNKEQENREGFLKIVIPNFQSAAINQHNQLVCLGRENVVTVDALNSTGNKKAIIQNLSLRAPWKIICMKDDILIASRGDNNITIYGKDCKIQTTIKPAINLTKPFDPVDMCQDARGNLWICDEENSTIFVCDKLFVIPMVTDLKRLTAIAIDSNNRLWVGYDGGKITIFDIKY